MKKESKKLSIKCLVIALIGSVLIGCGGADAEKSESATVAHDEYSGYNGMYSMESTGGTGLFTDGVTSEAPMEEMAEEEVMEDAVAEESGSAAPNLENTVASNRKLIRRVNLSAETQDFAGLTNFIEDKVVELGGYMESADVYGGSYEYETLRNAYYVVRVPVDKLDVLVGAVSEEANITRKNESATDVTLSYVDTKSQKEAYEIEYERLMLLLEQAEDIDTIVALESRLTTVRYEIQSLESQLRTYDNLVDFATIDINVSEVKIYTPVEPEVKTAWQRMTEGFKNSIWHIGNDIKEFGIDFVIALPYLILWAVIILAIVGIIRLIIKSIKKKKGKKNGKENRVCDTDRKTECGEVNLDESSDRSEDSNHIQQAANNQK